MTNEEYINMIGRTDPNRSSWYAASNPAQPDYSFSSSSSSQNGNNPSMLNLYNQMLSMNPTTTSRTRSTQTQQQNRSPEFEATSRQFVDMLNTLSANTTAAYQNKLGTYTDLIKSLSDLYGARGSAAAGSTQSSALASGLTPLEASGAGNEALATNLQQFFPALAGMRGEAADVGIQNQSALQSIQQQLNLPFISQVLAPYQQNVAGQTTRSSGTQTTTDPMARMNLLSQLSQAMETQKMQQQQLAQNDSLGWAQLAAQIQQNQMANQLGQGQLNVQNTLGQGNLGVAQGGLMAEIAKLAQGSQQFDVTQQNETQRAQGNWANTLQQIALQGQNQQAQNQFNRDTDFMLQGFTDIPNSPTDGFTTDDLDWLSWGNESSGGGTNWY